jgi:SAM-dependent methyltransferase
VALTGTEQAPPVSGPVRELDPPLDACPLCGAAAPRHYDTDHSGIRVDRCRSCGVRFMNPQYTDAYLERFYAQYVEDPAEHHDAVWLRRRWEAKASHFAFVERYAPVGRMLSVGCGDGVELEMARDRGWDVIGYDVDAETTQQVSLRTGIPVLAGDLFAHRLPPSGFQCVFMDQVIEHPKDPGRYLRLARLLLAPDGVLFAATPNIGSVSSTWKILLGRLGLRPGKRGRHYDTWHHLFYYTPRALRRILERHYGFHVLEIQGRYPAPAGVRLLPGLPLRTRVPWLVSTMRLVARRDDHVFDYVRRKRKARLAEPLSGLSS